MRQCVGQFIMGTPIPRFGGLAPSMTRVATRQIASAPRWIRHGSASRTLKRCQSSLLTVEEHWDGRRKRSDDRRSWAVKIFREGIASFGTRSRPTIWVAPTGLVCFLSGLPRPVAWAGMTPGRWPFPNTLSRAPPHIRLAGGKRSTPNRKGFPHSRPSASTRGSPLPQHQRCDPIPA
jgi:hypothetical protein